VVSVIPVSRRPAGANYKPATCSNGVSEARQATSGCGHLASGGLVRPDRVLPARAAFRYALSSRSRCCCWSLSGTRAGRAHECLECLVERIAGLGRSVASASEVSPAGLQPCRQRVADGLEGGAMIARDHELGKLRSGKRADRKLPSHGRLRTARTARTPAPARAATSRESRRRVR
jgi:hypothetical protein